MKNYFITFGIVLSLFVFISCNNKEEQFTEKLDQKELAKIEKQIAIYNANFFKVNNTVQASTQTKGGFRRFMNFLKLFLADGSGGEWGGHTGAKLGKNKTRGFNIGAVIGGILFSAICAIIQRRYETENLDATYLYNSANKDNLAGELHNKILHEILLEKDKYIAEDNVIKKDELYHAIENKLKSNNLYNFTDDDFNQIRNNKEKFFSFYEEIESIEYSSDSVYISTIYDKIINHFPTEKELIEINKNYTLNAVKIADQDILLSYANGFEKVVIESNLSSFEKSSILAPVAITKNSQSYWMAEPASN